MSVTETLFSLAQSGAFESLDFCGRLLRDRLPTIFLVIHDTISLENHFCVFGCGQAESAEHLVLTNSTFGSLYQLVRS